MKHKLNPSVKKKWLDALRSGKYTQCRAVLKKTSDSDPSPSFCCLGVLCDIYINEHDGVEWKHDVYSNTIQFSDNFPPDDVIVWAYNGHEHKRKSDNLGEQAFQIKHNGFNLNLWQLNDVNKKSFNEIADVIEDQL